jgi:hypothetical protein
MNWNLITVACTALALGVVATFDVIPGAGVYAGLAMIGVGIIIIALQLFAASPMQRRVSKPVAPPV